MLRSRFASILVASLLSLFGSQPAGAGACDDNVRTISEVTFSGAAWDVAVSGSHAYVSEFDSNRLSVVDISNAANPVVVSHLTFSVLEHVSAAGDWVYVPEGNHVHIVDVSNPQSPQIAATLDLSLPAVDVTPVGDLAYVVLGNGLGIVDISNPELPVLLGSVVTEGQAFEVAIQGNHAYLANGPYGLYVLDVADPANPTVVGHLPTPSWAFTIAADQGHAYIGGRFGVQVIDTTDPSQPALVATIAALGDVSSVVLVGSVIHIASDWNYKIVNVTDPSNPVTLAKIGTDLPKGLAIAGSLALMTHVRMRILDISQPTSPFTIGAVTLPEAMSVAVTGTYAFVPSETAIKVIDVGNPSAPAIVGSTPFAPHVAASGAIGLAMRKFSFGEYSHRVLDLSDPVHPIQRGSLVATSGIVEDAAIVGQTAYVLAEGLRIADLTNLDAPVWRGQVSFPDGGRGMAVGNSLAYVVTGSNYLRVVDVSAPSAPVIIGSVQLPYRPDAVAVSGPYAAVATIGGVVIVDVSDPTAPLVVGQTAWPRSGTSIVIEDRRAYVTSYYLGYQIVDFTNPASPILLSEGATAGYANSIAITNGTAVLVSGNSFETLPTCPATTGLPALPSAPPAMALSIRPNPWRMGESPALTVDFDLGQSDRAHLTIVDSMGRVISRLEERSRATGKHELRWDGRNQAGVPVAAGVYFIRCAFESRREVLTQRLVLLR